MSEALLDGLLGALGTTDAEPAGDRHTGVTLLKPVWNSQGDSLLGTNGTIGSHLAEGGRTCGKE